VWPTVVFVPKSAVAGKDRAQHYQHDGPIGGQGLFPGGRQVIGVVDVDATQADQLGEPMIRDIRNLLRGVELGVTLHRSLLPGHLVQIHVAAAVVQQADDPIRLSLLAIGGPPSMLPIRRRSVDALLATTRAEPLRSTSAGLADIPG
jgi:hypothetical protein